MSESLRGFSVRQDPFSGRTAHTKCCAYLLASSLATALLDSLFEHPDVILAFAPHGKFQPYCWYQPRFSAAC
jgi:hypothetical protein